MSSYALPQPVEPAPVGENEAILVASGDLRLSANQDCWPAQEAMEKRLVEAFARAKGRGGSGFALVCGTHCTNEAAYLAQKLARGVIGSNHVFSIDQNEKRSVEKVMQAALARGHAGEGVELLDAGRSGKLAHFQHAPLLGPQVPLQGRLDRIRIKSVKMHAAPAQPA